MMLIGLILSFSVGVSAQVMGSDYCPYMDTKMNFKVEKYLGKWYDYGHYATAFENKQKCISAVYGANPNGTVSVTNSGIFSNGEKTSIQGYAFADKSDKAKLSVVFPSVSNRAGPYWIVDTDYTSYSVVWSCSEYSSYNFQFAWILTRMRVPSVAVLQNARKVLEKNNIDPSLFQITNQKNCSPDD